MRKNLAVYVGLMLGVLAFICVSCKEKAESEPVCLPQKDTTIDYENIRFRPESESCLIKLKGVQSFSLTGRGILDVDAVSNQPSTEFHLEKGRFITKACTALIWSDSLGSKVRMLDGSAQFQYEGRKIDLYIHSELILGKDEVVVKEAEI